MVSRPLSFNFNLLISCGGTETACKELIFAIFVGCWFSSVTSKIYCTHSTRLAILRPLFFIVLCFANALGVMAFIPQPATPLPGTEENCLPSNPDRPEADSSMADEQQRFLPPVSTGPPVKVARGDGLPLNPDSIKVDGQAADNRTGLFTDDDEPREESLQRTDLPSSPGWFKGGSPAAERRTLLSRTLNELREEPSSLDGRDRDSFPVNSIQSLERLQNRNSDFSNESGSRSGTVFMRNTPGRDTSTDSASGSQRVYSFHNSSTPVSMLSRWSSMTRAGVGGGNNNRPRVRKIGPSKESLAPSTAQSSIANFPP